MQLYIDGPPGSQKNTTRIKAVEDKAASAVALKVPTTLVIVGPEPPTPSVAVGPDVAAAATTVPRVAILGSMMFNVIEAVAETTYCS